MIKYNLPFFEYLNDKSISRSFIHNILTKSLREAKYLNENPTQGTPSMEFGTAVHKYILEGCFRFNDEYAILPNGVKKDKRLKAYKNYEEQVSGKIIISFDEFNSILEIEKELKRQLPHQIINDIVDYTKGNTEVSILFEYNDLKFKIRPDKIIDNTIYDIKTCRDSNPKFLTNSSYNYGYYLQSYMYRLGLSIEKNIDINEVDFIFIFIGKKKPHDIVCMRTDSILSNIGKEDFNTAINIYKEALSNDLWPSYGNGKILNLSIPTWYKNNNFSHNDKIDYDNESILNDFF